MYKTAANGNLLRELSSVRCDDLEGWDGRAVRGRSKREGIYVYIHIDDSFVCTAETNTTLCSNYTTLKKNYKKKNHHQTFVIPSSQKAESYPYRVSIFFICLYSIQWPIVLI